MRISNRANRVRLLTMLFFGVLLLLGAGDNSARIENLGHQLMCMCGCNQILLECNHVGCTYSDTMRRELTAAIASGGDDKAVLQTFIEKYGTTVLAAPTKSGFNGIAWLIPYVALVVGIVGVALMVKIWRGRMTAAPLNAGASPADLQRFREQARKETQI
jgi:cytochrome c-type biogenesis protein CcmH